MNFLQVIILAFVQGLTEFLPVSSSGHLILIPSFLNWQDQGLAFDTIMHLGTLFAVIIFFRKRIWKIFQAFFNNKKDEESKQNRKLAWFIILATIPAAITGFLFEDYIDLYFRSSILVACNLIFWGIILFLADKYNSKLKEKKDLNNINLKDSIFIGLSQVLALIPGTSRSGITISAGIFSRVNKKSAIEFSFLLSIPVIAGAGFLQILDLYKEGFADISLNLLLVGLVTAFFSGILAIKFLLKIVEKWGFLPFVLYRFLLGILILLVL